MIIRYRDKPASAFIAECAIDPYCYGGGGVAAPCYGHGWCADECSRERGCVWARSSLTITIGDANDPPDPDWEPVSTYEALGAKCTLLLPKARK